VVSCCRIPALLDCFITALPLSPCDAAGTERPTGATGGKLSAANLFRPPGGRAVKGTRRRRARSGVPFFCFLFLGKQKEEGAGRGATRRC
jgi:hypothetical protein